jgi:glycosyltransferase involved in cell wall biosynthesis
LKIAMLALPFISVPPDGTGPVELSISNLVEALVRRGHEILLYASGDSHTSAHLRAIYPKSLKAMELPGGSIPTNVQELVKLEHLFWAVQDAIKQGADVIHSHNLSVTMFQRGLPIPQVFTLHFGHSADEGTPIMHKLFDFFNGFRNIQVVTLSESHKRSCPPRSNVHVIHHGIEMSHYEFQEQKQAYFLCLSRLTPEKGIHAAIDVAEALEIPLRIAGPNSRKLHGPTLGLDNDYEETLLARIEESRHAEYVGEADQAMKVDLLKRASALLFPVMWDEPFGLSLIESMACGTPVIAFNRGSVPEIVKNGVSGYIVESKEEMLRMAREVKNISPAAVRAHVRDNFSADVMAERYEKVYLAAQQNFQLHESDLV